MLLFFIGPTTLYPGKVGIFAAQDIPPGVYLPIFAKDDYRLMRKKTLATLPKSEIFAGYCVLDSSGVHAPSNFNRMSIGWYINHAEEPNAEHRNYRFYSRAAIKAGEEVTIDMKTIGDERYPS